MAAKALGGGEVAVGDVSEDLPEFLARARARRASACALALPCFLDDRLHLGHDLVMGDGRALVRQRGGDLRLEPFLVSCGLFGGGELRDEGGMSGHMPKHKAMTALAKLRATRALAWKRMPDTAGKLGREVTGARDKNR